MGSPKALLEIERKTFLETLLSRYAAVRVPVYVVLGAHSAEIRQQIDLSSVTVLINQDPSRGPLSSLLIALEQASQSDAFILHPVDHPIISEETIQLLLSTAKRLPHTILLPEFRGKRGHPILIPSKYYPDLREAPLSMGARWVVRSNRGANHLVPVNDPGILLDIDTREAYEQLVGHPRLYR